MDFFNIRRRSVKKESLEIYPDFSVRGTNDIMVRGGDFYAVWDEEAGLWSTNEYDVARLVDKELNDYYENRAKDLFACDIDVKWMSSYSSGSWKLYRQWICNLPDNYHQLDAELTFAGQDVKKEDYVSKRLPYPLIPGSCEAYLELVTTLYDEDELRKIEWAIGAVIAGEAKDIQKFLVLYGDAGGGKSTILNIIQQLFQGYYTMFEAKALASSNNSFSTETFKSSPLVAIQHDGDLSRIEDNSKLNSIVSHEEMLINEKYKSGYMGRINAFLFMATNRPVKITDAKSGLIRRLISVTPSGRHVPNDVYNNLVRQISFELGPIACRCLDIYNEMGKNYYASYRPVNMMFRTDTFFNFVESEYFTFADADMVTLKQAYAMYREFCEYSQIHSIMPMYVFRDELKNYFERFDEVVRIGETRHRSLYRGFIKEKFKGIINTEEFDEQEVRPKVLVLDSETSIFDEMLADSKAQYATDDGTPRKKWENVRTKLKDIDTSQLHYVKVPENHIVIDFDLKDDEGKKNAYLNLQEAYKWPPTYAELSKSGEGVHLHYIYDGDVTKLSRVYSYGIEIKVYSGNSSLRRKLTKCNSLGIAHISSGLPTKEEPVVNFTSVKSERGLRELIERNLRKEIHPGTKPSIDFIKKILDDAYSSGLKYDVSDMQTKVLAFANNSTNQAEYCVRLVGEMKFKSEESSSAVDSYRDDRLVFFDVEVFPNLFLVNWKYQGKDATVVRMINPSPSDIEDLMQMRLVGFNCRRYDNHILYARYLGYDNLQLYKLSQKIVSGESRNALFGEAYNLSYTDVYDFASAANKQSLKKWEIQLGLHHQELALPWDQPVDETRWEEVAKYCDNDVISTEAVFEHLSGDWAARQILAELSGLSVNDTTNAHSARIIFGKNKHPQSEFVYTDLSKEFPGYKFERGKSSYRGEDPGEGGYVYAEHGMYTNVGLLDIASMHPSSIEALNLFGKYTKVFSDLKKARVYIKHEDYEKAGELLDGKLKPFLDELSSHTAKYTSKDLSAALKTVINSVYGLSSAKFDNPFRDPRNKDNIVAKRGALFMIDLKHACQEKGWTVVHIKTDSIKLADIDQEKIDFVFEFGKKYGYTFEHEATYSKMCIVNNSTYISKLSYGDDGMRKSKRDDCKWSATGEQFAKPYVFKTLFSHDPIEFEDLCETKSVTTAMYLDMNESCQDVSDFEKELADRQKKEQPFVNKEYKELSDKDLRNAIDQGHIYTFVGRVGSFVPMKPGSGGGILLRQKDDKYYSVGGTKGYRWLEAESVKLMHKEKEVDTSYHNKLVDEAIVDIGKYGDAEWFISDDEGIINNKKGSK